MSVTAFPGAPAPGPIVVCPETSTPTGRPLRLFLIDPHTVLREGLRAILGSLPGFRIVGDAGDWSGARNALLASEPDPVGTEITQPHRSGSDLALWLKQVGPRTRLVALTMHEDRSYLKEMLAAGASAYVLRRSTTDELVRALQLAASGGCYIDPTMGQALVESLTRRTKRPDHLEPLLSEREEAVLRRVEQGFANKEIAARLKIGVNTVETYKARGMEKLELDGRCALIRYALRQGWLERA